MTRIANRCQCSWNEMANQINNGNKLHIKNSSAKISGIN